MVDVDVVLAVLVMLDPMVCCQVRTIEVAWLYNQERREQTPSYGDV